MRAYRYNVFKGDQQARLYVFAENRAEADEQVRELTAYNTRLEFVKRVPVHTVDYGYAQHTTEELIR